MIDPPPEFVADFEVTAPEDLIVPARYSRARLLIRWRGDPVGVLKAPVRGGRVFAGEVGRLVARRLGRALARKWVAEELRYRGWRPGCSVSETWRERGEPDSARLPTVSVVICTRDRPGDLEACLESIGRSRHPPLEVLVIDNAPATDETRALMARRFPDPRYVPEEAPGLDHARNRGLREARGEIVAFTDDDVRVDPGWTGEIARAFGASPELGLLTGLVEPAELDTPAQHWFESYGGFGRGTLPVYRILGRGCAMNWGFAGVGTMGAGANMAVRAAMVADTGVFDPALDAGTPSLGGGDLDLFHRALKAGWLCKYDPRAVVRHRHRRGMDELSGQMFGYGYGLACMMQREARFFPEDRKVLGRLRRWWWRKGLLRRLCRACWIPGWFPPRLVWEEIRGFAAAGGAYRRIRRRIVPDESLAPDRFPGAGDPAEPIPLMAIVRVDLSEPVRDLPEGAACHLLEVEGFCKGRRLGRIRIATGGRAVSAARLADELAAGFDRELLSEPGDGAVGEFDRFLVELPGLLGLGPRRPERLAPEVPVSILLATCGRVDSLRRCLRSIGRLETERPLQVLVIDNRPGGWDRSSIESEFGWVEWVDEAKAGLAYARNAGAAVANGRVFVMTDDDVEVDPDWLEKLVAPFERADVVGVAGGVLPASLKSEAARFFELYGGLDRGARRREYGPEWFRSRGRRGLPTWEIGATANFAIRAGFFEGPDARHLLEWLGPGLPSGVGEDTFMFYEAIAAGGTIIHEPDAVLVHHHRETRRELQKQLFDYSKGHVCYHLATLLAYRDGRALVRILHEVPGWWLARAFRKIRRGYPYPWRMLLAELAGYLAGPAALLRSRMIVKRRGPGARRTVRAPADGVVPESVPNQASGT